MPAIASIPKRPFATSSPRWRLALLCGILSLGGIAVAKGHAQPPVNAPSPPTDNHGDPLPEGAVGRFGTLRFRRGPGRAVIRPDGKTFLDVDQLLAVRTYDAATGLLLGTEQLPADGVEGTIAIARNGRAV